MRELMLRPRRFSDLRASLPGISANILTMRLERLRILDILRRRQLAPPANVQVYELTPWGHEAEPLFQAISRWALGSPLHDPTLPLAPVSAMLALRAMLRPDHSAPPMTAGFRFGRDMFISELSGSSLHIRRGKPDVVDIEFDTDTTSFVRLVYGKQPLEALERQGLLTLKGDRAGAKVFVNSFELPAHVS